jgi:hypothetical protein
VSEDDVDEPNVLAMLKFEARCFDYERLLFEEKSFFMYHDQ